VKENALFQRMRAAADQEEEERAAFAAAEAAAAAAEEEEEKAEAEAVQGSEDPWQPAADEVRRPLRPATCRFDWDFPMRRVFLSRNNEGATDAGRPGACTITTSTQVTRVFDFKGGEAAACVIHYNIAYVLSMIHDNMVCGRLLSPHVTSGGRGSRMGETADQSR
jgi:hypothetical protein